MRDPTSRSTLRPEAPAARSASSASRSAAASARRSAAASLSAAASAVEARPVVPQDPCRRRLHREPPSVLPHRPHLPPHHSGSDVLVRRLVLHRTDAMPVERDSACTMEAVGVRSKTELLGDHGSITERHSHDHVMSIHLRHHHRHHHHHAGTI